MNRSALALTFLGAGAIGCSYTQVFELAPAPDAGDDVEPPTAIVPDAGCGGASDPDHCGACGHGCLGGTCRSGRCQPVVLASGQGDASWPGYTSDVGSPHEGPDRLAVDATHVYWLNLRGEVKRVPVVGGASELVATTAQGPCWIALHGSFVYFATLAGEIHRVAKENGNAAAPERIAAAQGPRRAIHLFSSVYPTELSVIDERLYWADGTGVYSCPASGCAGAPTVVASGSLELRPMSFAIDASGVKYRSAELHRSTGPSSTKLEYSVSTFRESQWLGLAESTAYYELHGGKDEVYALATAISGATGVVRWTESAVTFLASGAAVPAAPRGLALDGAAVYWANAPPPRIAVEERTASVVRCTKTGCASPEVLAEGQIVPRAVAVGEDAVYWTTGDGNVMKVAKPAGASPSLP
ncbi:MAG: hypothetical protein KF782_12740 [Labilithrix sp.]|nr:hypothetical protein [Labilithrix sp.]